MFPGTTLEVIYAIVHLTTLGSGVRVVDPADPTHILRAGWISFGANPNTIGGIARDYWEYPWYLNFTENRWVPNTGSPGTTLPVHRASRVRWYLSAGTLGHLYIFGN